jgi:hypothetical protein
LNLVEKNKEIKGGLSHEHKPRHSIEGVNFFYLRGEKRAKDVKYFGFGVANNNHHHHHHHKKLYVLYIKL